MLVDPWREGLCSSRSHSQSSPRSRSRSSAVRPNANFNNFPFVASYSDYVFHPNSKTSPHIVPYSLHTPPPPQPSISPPPLPNARDIFCCDAPSHMYNLPTSPLAALHARSFPCSTLKPHFVNNNFVPPSSRHGTPIHQGITLRPSAPISPLSVNVPLPSTHVLPLPTLPTLPQVTFTVLPSSEFKPLSVPNLSSIPILKTKLDFLAWENQVVLMLQSLDLYGHILDPSMVIHPDLPLDEHPSVTPNLPASYTKPELDAWKKWHMNDALACQILTGRLGDVVRAHVGVHPYPLSNPLRTF